MALYVNGDNATYFVTFKVEYVPKAIKKVKGNKNITANIYRIQITDSIICEHFLKAFLILC